MLIAVIGADARRVYHTAHFEADQRHELACDMDVQRLYLSFGKLSQWKGTSLTQEVRVRKKVLTSMLLSSDN